MPTYVSLFRWTDQGIRDAKGTVERQIDAVSREREAGWFHQMRSGTVTTLTARMRSGAIIARLCRTSTPRRSAIGPSTVSSETARVY